MRRFAILSATVLGLALGQSQAHAQAGTSATQSPPAPNSAASFAQPSNSLPRGGATSTAITPGGSVANTPVATPAASAPAVNTLHPLRQPRRPRRPFFRRRPATTAPAPSSDARPATPAVTFAMAGAPAAA